MRFSIRTLLIAVSILCAGLGSLATYQAVWKSHCRNLEPSLFAYVLQDEINFEVDNAPPEFEFEGVVYNSEPPIIAIYFALGRGDDGDWISPSDELLGKIGLDSVLPASKVGREGVVHYIDNIRWIDWNTVVIDHGMYGGPLYGGGSRNAKYQFRDGEWHIVDYGEQWVS